MGMTTGALTLAALADSAKAQTKSEEAKASAQDALGQIATITQAVVTAEAAAVSANASALAATGSASAAAQTATDALDTATGAVNNGVLLNNQVKSMSTVVVALDAAVTAVDIKAAAAKTSAEAAKVASDAASASVKLLTSTIGLVAVSASDATTAAATAQSKVNSVEAGLATANTSITALAASVGTAQTDAANAKTDAATAIAKASSASNYATEMHVDPVNGLDANSGSAGFPIKTLAKALTLLTNSGWRLILHAGTYAEAVTFNKLNVTIDGLTGAGALVNLTGDWTFSHASSSVRCAGIAFTNLTHSGAGGLYLGANTSVRNLCTKSGSGYFEARDADLSGIGVSVTGAGYFNVFRGKAVAVNVNNVSAVATISGSENLAIPVCVAGTMQLLNNIVFAAGGTGNAVTGGASSVVVMHGNQCYTPTGTQARVALAGMHSYSADQFDIANSTLTGTNLGTVDNFNAIKVLGSVAAGSVTSSGLVSASSLAMPWAQEKAYAAGVWVDKAGKLAKSNGAIPANTAYATGTTGATWTELSGSSASVIVTIQANSDSFPVGSKMGDAVIVTTDGAATGNALEYWVNSGNSTWLKAAQVSPVTSGAILDNTNGDHTTYTIKGRYIVPASDQVDSYFLGHSGQYADWDGYKFTFSTPVNGSKVVINSGVNAGQTWVYTSATSTWAKVDDGLSQVSLYDQTKAYTAAKSLVVKDLVLYKPNSDIAANIAFSEGTGAGKFSRVGAKARAVITKVSNTGGNGLIFIADGKLFFARGTEGNGAWAAAQSSEGRIATLRCSIPAAYEIVIRNATVGATVVDAGIVNTMAWALMSDGDLFVWGNNPYGNLGFGDLTARYIPTRTQQNVAKVFTHHSQEQRSFDFMRMFIQTTDGKVWCCGYNGQGQCGIGSTTSPTVWTEVTAAGLFPKSVWVMGSYIGFTFIQKADGNCIIAGYARGGGSLGIGAANDVLTFTNANIWNGGDVAFTVKQVEAGLGYNDTTANDTTNMLVLSDNGTTSRLLLCGANSWGTLGNGTLTGIGTTPVPPANLTKRIKKIVRMGDGPGSVHALTYDNELWSWGRGGQGALGRGATGDSGSPAIAETGVVDIFQLSASAQYGYETTSPVILKNDGYYYSCGWGGAGLNAYGGTQNVDIYQKMMFPRGAVMKAFGQFSTYINRFTRVAVSEDGRVYAWGYGANYNIETNNTLNYALPVDVTPSVFSA
jgi:alpha-tubulin suppressor-like RCC1 family protein